ncbi:maleylpyruvate isomerase family mycothiol-dependent enzyme [Pseudonocardia lacus]|uniref:maleylpyruvate isomerase family mycothiol-dependent enzyme n=1 Tax=Pseudonocardia lacus TaxID=2835865 RepID=UPI001BDD7EC8|nr:maleylpyruvate isomerase family mycothiol-dependent enzyme [Pseudonocardia lacus]
MSSSAPPPSGLRERVVVAARAVRPAGRAVPEPAPITAVEAFSRAADALNGLLSALADDQWETVALRGLDAYGLVAHLTGVEDDVRAALEGDPGVADIDHVAATRSQPARTPEGTRVAWRTAVDATLTHLAATDDLDQVVAVHRIRLPLRSLLVARAFELWAHENDIRAAIGMPRRDPDPSTLTLMTTLATRLLPFGVARLGNGQAPVDLHLVLTGDGGGTWDLPLGDRGAPAPALRDVPEVTIVAEAVDFCRLVANRLRPADLPTHLGGSVVHVPHILAGAAALALD